MTASLATEPLRPTALARLSPEEVRITMQEALDTALAGGAG